MIALYTMMFKNLIPELQNYHITFWFESLALWALGISWLVKGETLFADGKE